MTHVLRHAEADDTLCGLPMTTVVTDSVIPMQMALAYHEHGVLGRECQCLVCCAAVRRHVGSWT